MRPKGAGIDWVLGGGGEGGQRVFLRQTLFFFAALILLYEPSTPTWYLQLFFKLPRLRSRSRDSAFMELCRPYGLPPGQAAVRREELSVLFSPGNFLV